MQHRRACAFLLCGASALVLASAASAQTAAAPGRSAQVEEVVVTGSRVITNGVNSPTPLTVVTTQQLIDVRPGPIAEALADLPAMNGSRISTSNPGGGTTNTASNSLNIRNMSSLRGLVLFDGTRVAPSTFDQVVDLNMIPQLLMQRVDVVTGGVSAVYGSDAVSGAVNFVTDRNFNGLKLNVEGGIAEFGDDRVFAAGTAFGTSLLDGRAHFEGSLEYRKDPGIAYRSARPWNTEYWGMVGAGTAASPYTMVKNLRFSNLSFGGLITGATGPGAVLNNQTFTPQGTLRPFVNGTPSGSTNVQVGGDGVFNDGSLKAALETKQAFGRFDFDVSQNTHFFVEGIYNRNLGRSSAAWPSLTTLQFDGQNPYLPAANQFTGTFRLSKRMADFPRAESENHQTQQFLLTGLSGKFGEKYSWDLGASHSSVKSTTINNGNMNNQRLWAALDAVRDATGAIVCRVAVTNPGLYPGCVPLNVFGENVASAAAKAYVSGPTQFTVENVIDDVTAAISGSPFGLPAGPVNVALSSEWRRQSMQVMSNALPSDLANCTGLRFNCVQGTSRPYFNGSLDKLATKSNTVSEAAIEADVPLLKNVFLAKDLSLNAAARYTSYKISGQVTTWKAGVVWQVTDEFKLRGTRSRDIRAPTLYDLYQPQTINPNGNVTDMLTGVVGTATIIAGGNSKLVPEVANTKTLGFVYQPEWLPRFNFSMDAYDIRVAGAINSQQGILPESQLRCYNSGGAGADCQLQVRPLGNYTNKTPANTATTWYTATINLSELRAYGVDFDASYSRELLGNNLTVRGLLTWQPHFLTTIPGTATQDSAGISGGMQGAPKVRWNLFASYDVGNLNIGVRERWRSKSISNTLNGLVYAAEGVPSQAYTDLNLRYRLATRFGQSDLYLNVQNLWNTEPFPYLGNPQLANLGIFGGFPPGDDTIGRYFTFGIRFRR